MLLYGRGPSTVYTLNEYLAMIHSGCRVRFLSTDANIELRKQVFDLLRRRSFAILSIWWSRSVLLVEGGGRYPLASNSDFSRWFCIPSIVYLQNVTRRCFYRKAMEKPKCNITVPCRLHNTGRGSSCDLMNDSLFPTRKAAVTVSATADCTHWMLKHPQI